MSQFFHHPDGWITINNGVDSLMIRLSEFQIYEPGYVLAAPYTWQIYTPGVSHELHTATNQVGGEFPWTVGDGYIANLDDYIDEHNNPTLTLQEAKNEKILAVQDLSATFKMGGINLFTTTMPSSPQIDANALASYTLATSTPMGYYLKDEDGVHVPLTLAQLNDLNDAIVELYLLCAINVDDLTDNINALATVEDVEDFDINIGWPTVPYTP